MRCARARATGAGADRNLRHVTTRRAARVTEENVGAQIIVLMPQNVVRVGPTCAGVDHVLARVQKQMLHHVVFHFCVIGAARPTRVDLEFLWPTTFRVRVKDIYAQCYGCVYR